MPEAALCLAQLLECMARDLDEAGRAVNVAGEDAQAEDASGAPLSGNI